MMNGNDTGGLFGLPYVLTISLLVLLVIILAAVALVLVRVRKQVEDLSGAEAHAPRKQGWLSRQWHNFTSRVNMTMFVLSIVGLLGFLGAVGLYKRAQDLGTQIGYAPEQPIKFSHKLHAGQYGIQCQYCHQGVEKGKNAGIPSLNTCMNCHNAVNEGPKYGANEIAKIYNALDIKDPGSFNKKGAGPNAKPVKWVRIHNLPDHVYFSHAQHVVAGKLQCENCHGEVAQMDRVQQVSTLEMGWCINCHREKTVNSDNPYYSGTYDFVKKHKSYTVAQMGGLECAKCHY